MLSVVFLGFPGGTWISRWRLKMLLIDYLLPSHTIDSVRGIWNHSELNVLVVYGLWHEFHKTLKQVMIILFIGYICKIPLSDIPPQMLFDSINMFGYIFIHKRALLIVSSSAKYFNYSMGMCICMTIIALKVKLKLKQKNNWQRKH